MMLDFSRKWLTTSHRVQFHWAPDRAAGAFGWAVNESAFLVACGGGISIMGNMLIPRFSLLTLFVGMTLLTGFFTWWRGPFVETTGLWVRRLASAV